MHDEIYDDTVAALGSLAGRVCAITGTTTGTGYWTAIAAARCSAACIMLLNRPSSRANSCKVAVQREADKNGGGFTEVVQIDCDLLSFVSVKAAATAILEKSGQHGGLDALICNAGIMAVPDQRTKDGFDVQMQVNHLSHFLLSKLLMPSLEAASSARGEARIVQHSSGARKPNKRSSRPGSDDLVAKYFEKAPAGALGGDGIGAGFARYHQTKLANLAFAMGLHKKLAAAGSKVKSCCAEPGVAKTDLTKNTARPHSFLKRRIFGAVGVLMSCSGGHIQSAADGACPLIVAAFDGRTASGDMWMPSKHIPVSALPPSPQALLPLDHLNAEISPEKRRKVALLDATLCPFAPPPHQGVLGGVCCAG